MKNYTREQMVMAFCRSLMPPPTGGIRESAELFIDSLATENKPHCWGKMNWILGYPKGEEPKSSICNCEHGAMKCLKLTRESNPTSIK